MKFYLAATGTVFGALAIAHLWRIVAESHSLATNPWFVGITLISAALSIWAFRLLLRNR
jgi:dolichyl-phosphate-mannose--protein O-mannosyl transferase